MPLTAGARVGPYEVVAVLGAGGMGEVYGDGALASPDGQYVYYKHVGNTGSIYRMRSDGTDDTAIVSENAFAVLPYAVTTSGVWFIAVPASGRPYWSIRKLQFSDHRIVEVSKLDGRPDGLQLSVSPDEQYALVTKIDLSGTDLLLVNNFR